MVSPFDSSLTSSTLGPWLDTNASVDGSIGAYSFYTDPVGDGYNKIALTTLTPQASSGAYFKVNTASISTPGYTYIGLTQSLTSSTQLVDQYFSKIDIGIKIDPDIVQVVIGGAEKQIIGNTSSIYTVIFDAKSGVAVFKNDSVVYIATLSELYNNGANITLTDPLNLGFVSYSPELDIPFDAGGVSGLDLKIGEGGLLDPISIQSSFSVITPSGETSIRIDLKEVENASYAYEVTQLSQPPQVIGTFTSSNYTVSDNPRRVTLSFTNPLMNGLDLKIVRVSGYGVKSLPFTLTNKTVSATNVSTYGVDTGLDYYNAALNLSHPQFSSANGIAIIDTILLPQINGKTRLTTGDDQISIFPITGSLAKFPIGPSSLVSVICGTIDPNDSTVLNVNQSISTFSVNGWRLGGGRFGEMLQLAALTAVEVPLFQKGSSPTLTLSWAGGVSKAQVAIFTQSQSQDYYFKGSLSSLPGYYATANVTNDTIQLSAPADGTYYLYPLTVSDDTLIAHLGTEASVSLIGTLLPLGASPHTPVIERVDATTVSSLTTVYWSQEAGDTTYADTIKFDVTIKTLAGEVVETVQGLLSPVHTFSNIPEGTYNVTVTAYSAEDVTAESLPFEYYQPGVGGGGSGSTGNTGSNGHNNMATLVYNPIYEISTSYTEDVTVYGETAAPRADYTEDIAVNDVPVADLNAVLSFSKSDEAAASGFAIDLAGVSARVKTALDAKLLVDHPAYDLATLGVDARSILSHSPGSWDADVSALNGAKVDDAARNVYEQAADQGKLDAAAGKMNLASGDKFVFYIKCTATQSLTVTTDATIAVAGATASDVAPLTTDKTTSSTTEHKYRVTMTAA